MPLQLRSQSSRRRAALLAAAAALALTPAIVAAQALRLHAVEEGSERPLAGAIADVLDTRDSVIARTVLAADGRRFLPLPSPGTYRVRLGRIGYQPYLGAPVTVAGTGTVDVELRAPARRVVLSTVTVTAARRCSSDALSDPGMAALWEEIRKALTTTVLSREADILTLETRPFRRVLDEDRKIQAEFVGLPRSTEAERPYIARPAAELQEEGYVRSEGSGTVFYAPDEQVLLSDGFLVTHCFEAVRGDGPAAGLLGLRFTPASRRAVNDIAGTLWVDSASAELRYLDFWYVHSSMPRPVLGEDRSGGQVVFERLPTGLWIVSAWRLRMPRFSGGRVVGPNSRPDSYEETGGVVAPLGTDGAPPPPVLAPYRALLAPARIAGTVYDSLAMRPLAGARVWIVPTEPAEVVEMGLGSRDASLAAEPMADTADATGRFSLDSIPAGTWRLGFEHPGLDTLGIVPTRYELRLKPGATIAADLAVPSLTTLAKGCVLPEDTPPDQHGGLLVGVVRSAADQRPLANALVRASWVDITVFDFFLSTSRPSMVETRTDSLGVYRLCGVPDSTIATVQAAGPHSATGQVSVQVGPLGVTRVNLQLAEVGEGELAPRPGLLLGSVRDTAGAPVHGARVLLDGSTLETRTDSAGRFQLAGVPPGTQTGEVRLVGRTPGRRTVDVVPGDTTRVALTLVRTQRVGPILDAVVILGARPTAMSARVADAVRRHKSGMGHLFTAGQIAERATIPTVLQDVPGLRMGAASAGNSQLVAWMRYQGFGGGECVARLYIDGIESDYDELLMLGPEDVEAIEVYRNPAQAPFFATGASHYGRSELCGVVIVWMKR